MNRLSRARLPVLTKPVLNSKKVLTVLLFDEFTDADATNLVTGHTVAPINVPGDAWASGMTWLIYNNTLRSPSGGAMCPANKQTGVNNLKASVKVYTGTESGSGYSQSMGIMFRYKNDITHWEAVIDKGGSLFAIYKIPNAAAELMASASVSISANTWYTIEVIAVGSVITATLNGSNPLTVIDAYGNTYTKCGVRSGGDPTTHFDDFKVYAA